MCNWLAKYGNGYKIKEGRFKKELLKRFKLHVN